MAVNINLHQPRVEHALTEHDDNNGEPTTPDGQTPSQSNTSIAAPTDQQGNSAGDGSGSNNDADANESYTPAPPPPKESIPLPAQFRYGLGDTVIMGRPDYMRAYMERVQPSTGEPSVHEAAFAPVPRAENTLPLATPPQSLATKPIPMPKPDGIMSPTSASLPTPATAALPAITNAPRIGGEAVRQALAADQRNSQNVISTAPTASAAELDAIDAMLADPINKQLIDLAKPQMGLADTKNWVAEAQIKLYGEARFQEMMYLHRALPMVQNAYAGALAVAYSASTTLGYYDVVRDQPIPASSTFNLDAFNTEYASRTDFMAQAFAAKFPGIPVTMGTSTVGATSGDGAAEGISVPTFQVGGLFEIRLQNLMLPGNSDSAPTQPERPIYGAYVETLGAYGDGVIALGPDIGDHRAMFDDTAVWFDPSLGFVTHLGNFKEDKPSNFDRVVETVVQVGITAAFVYAGSTFLFSPGAAATLTTPAIAPGIFSNGILGFTANSWQYAVIQGGTQAAIGTVANSAVTGRTLTLADLGRSILTGGVMGGLVHYANLNTYGITTQNGVQVVNWGERLTSIVGRSTMQGILQQVTGGRFQDGLRNGLASSLSNELSRTLGAEINRWARENHVDPYVASQLRMVAQGFSSALVQTAANGGQAGIETFLNDLINGQIGAAGEVERAEINALTAQYNTAVAANDYTAQATILNDLTNRWQINHPTDTDEQALAQVAAGLGWTVDESRFVRDGNGRLVARQGDVLILPDDYDQDTNEDARELRVNAEIERFRALAPGESEQTLRQYAERAVQIQDDIKGISGLRSDLTNNEARQIALGLQTDRERIQAYADRLNAIPEDQKPFELELIRSEFAGSELMQRFSQLIGPVTPLVGSEPMTRQQQLRLLDVVLGVVPITGEATSIYEFIYGKSPASQEEASRVWAAVGILSAGYGRVGGRLLTAEQRVARELEYAGGTSGTWNRKPPGITTDASTVLRTSLGPPPAGMINPEAHHLVGFGRADVRTQQILNEHGITPNAAGNGVWLSAEQHALTYGSYEKEYKNWVGRQFEGVTSKPEAIAVLERIKDTLRDLKPGNTPPWRTGK